MNGMVVMRTETYLPYFTMTGLRYINTLREHSTYILHRSAVYVRTARCGTAARFYLFRIVIVNLSVCIYG